MKVLLLSDTHSYLDDIILKYCREADEIWHAGDFGNVGVADQLAALKKLRGVYGNIDSQQLRLIFPQDLFFTVRGLTVLMTHIGGYPGAWPPRIKQLISENNPNVIICGHSHILKVARDQKHNNMLCINPGAAGKVGFHQQRTMIRMVVENAKVEVLEVIELGKK